LSVQLRLVLDTNVVLSALLWRGRPAELLDLAETPQVRLFTSEWLIAELQESLVQTSACKSSRRNRSYAG
jgi:putative PIN family toxin of toxin-antitoxin system